MEINIFIYYWNCLFRSCWSLWSYESIKANGFLWSVWYELPWRSIIYQTSFFNWYLPVRLNFCIIFRPSGIFPTVSFQVLLLLNFVLDVGILCDSCIFVSVHKKADACRTAAAVSRVLILTLDWLGGVSSKTYYFNASIAEALYCATSSKVISCVIFPSTYHSMCCIVILRVMLCRENSRIYLQYSYFTHFPEEKKNWNGFLKHRF